MHAGCLNFNQGLLPARVFKYDMILPRLELGVDASHGFIELEEGLFDWPRPALAWGAWRPDFGESSSSTYY